MKKIIIAIIFVFSGVAWSSSFDQNTDIKSKYEFEIDASENNAKLAARLLRFQNGEVSESEIKEYREALESNVTKAYAQDVAVDEELIRPVDRQVAKENQGWVESSYEYIASLFSSEDEVLKDTNTTYEGAQ